VTDAAGNTASTAYGPWFDQPSAVTNALGNTACYGYDLRGRKTAEWGTAIQPLLFGYDEADRMTSLTTLRAGAGAGPGPEGRMCCGKQTEVRAKYAKLKEEAV